VVGKRETEPLKLLAAGKVGRLVKAQEND